MTRSIVSSPPPRPTSSGCRTSLTTGFVPDALNQAVCQQCPAEGSGLIHHRDRDGQYLAIRYTERLAEAGIDTSVGGVGDSCDNALAESVIGLFRTEVIEFFGAWKSVARVEWETLQWVNWYNTERRHGAIGHRTAAGNAGRFPCKHASMQASTPLIKSHRF